MKQPRRNPDGKRNQKTFVPRDESAFYKRNAKNFQHHADGGKQKNDECFTQNPDAFLYISAPTFRFVSPPAYTLFHALFHNI